MESKSSQFNRATGLLVIEVIASNPNGDPDRESDPRQRPDEHGEISPVSFKRKIRDLVEQKDGPVWVTIAKTFNPALADANFEILEQRGRNREMIIKMGESEFKSKYWDARVFGNTILEKGVSNFIKTGVIQFGLGISVAPIYIERMTTTNKAGVEKDKDRGMAPLGFRIVQHGVYCMPFFVNPTAAIKTGCTAQDIKLLLKLIPYAYTHTASYVRPSVEIRHAWYIEHNSPLGSCSDFALIDALKPRKKHEPDKPSKNWQDYEQPQILPDDLKKKVSSFKDLMLVN